MANDMESLHLPRLDLGIFKSSCRYLERIGKPSIPFQPPAWALPASRKPASVALIDVFKLNEVIASVSVDTKSYFVFGRNALVCDIVLEHCSISRMHACLVHHSDGSAYIVDLGSCHGTFMDAEKLEPLRPTLITHGAQLRFGVSSRSYRFKTFESREQILRRLHATVGLHDDERLLQTNTLLNRFVSYRLDVPAQTHQSVVHPHSRPPALRTVTSRARAEAANRVASNSTDTNEDTSQVEDESSSSSTSSHRHSAENLDSFAMVDIAEEPSQRPLASRKRTRPLSATDRTNQVFLTFDMKRVQFVVDPPTIIPPPPPSDEAYDQHARSHVVANEPDDVAMECDDDDEYAAAVPPLLNYGPMGDTPMDEYMMENPFATVAPDSGRCAMPLSLQFPLCSDRPSLDFGRRRSTIG
ncbi:hypothetical protein SPRG_15363 [Saprolegnia parasitica CBS 223.65]|uniref:FHA domain-containing protein n=1 Tax=Saprolegnia parasitica (strain CBS 223.65) TaxID=695850 RepID=A0A067BMK9_SAPPC|nr:hypothetical protein SPRG_15363 [Saprolegnia parasitica CBS 223.65]KDO19458.1 hypothetical protein SPRG_15363 [Saprolegnia parasitica CBS 223.65]|eukprot:XP_012209841.1 hypothetical protein SPRG_15363 [Saprolegnia parasitica CBS 223.65]